MQDLKKIADYSQLIISLTILSTVRKAARLAVYDEIMIRVKNHQIPPTMRVEAALGFKSDLKCKTEIMNYYSKSTKFFWHSLF